MVHGVTADVVLVSVQVLLPVLLKFPKPRYCVLIFETSSAAFETPPSASVSAVLNATTVPPMLKPDSSMSWLVPPVNVIALACGPEPPFAKPPVIVPPLMMVRPLPTIPTPPAPAVPFPPMIPGTGLTP